MGRKRRLSWGFSHHDRPLGKPFLTPAEAAFIQRQRQLRASDQAIAHMLGRPVADMRLTVIVDGDTTASDGPTDAERHRRNELNRLHRTTVWRASK